jgi:hypothetical protein
MALTRMRWTNTGADLISPRVRDGAMVRQIDEPRARRRDVHIYLPAVKTVDQSAPPTRAESVRVRTHDAAPPRRPRDREREPGELRSLAEERRSDARS